MRQSVRLEWSGDEDLVDGKLQETYAAHRKLLDFISSIGLDERKTPSLIKDDLQQCIQLLERDRQFLIEGIQYLSTKMFTSTCT